MMESLELSEEMRNILEGAMTEAGRVAFRVADAVVLEHAPRVKTSEPVTLGRVRFDCLCAMALLGLATAAQYARLNEPAPAAEGPKGEEVPVEPTT